MGGEVRRPRLNKHDKGKVYLERIGTIGPGLLKDLKARELSLVNHKRQGPLQAFREKRRIKEAEEGDYFTPAKSGLETKASTQKKTSIYIRYIVFLIAKPIMNYNVTSYLRSNSLERT